MSGVPVGHRAVGLAWLPPSADALLALAADPPDPRAIARDPAALAHTLRFARPTIDPNQFALTPALLSQPSLCDNAAALLEHSDLPHPAPDHVERTARVAAEVAADLARRYEVCTPAAALTSALLAPLGWYAVRAVEPTEVRACLDELGRSDRSDTVQCRRWGLSATAITRRLAGRWRLPPWLASTIGFLRLEPEDAVAVGAPGGLVRVVQAAVAAAEETLGTLGLVDGQVIDRGGELVSDALALAESAAARPSPEQVETRGVPVWLLARLLRATAGARRTAGSVWLAEAESRVDRLAGALADLRSEFHSRLRDTRLEGLAEFAAGASHEINNPLAVIRGHAQLLLAREDDPDRRRQLESIVRQTRRVHDLLHGTLQFARPPRAVPVPVRVAEWLARVVDAYSSEADAKGVTLDFAGSRHAVDLGRFDPEQAGQALGQLIRNAIEAAPSGGWVRVALMYQDGMTVISVEDSGPGPAEGDRDHLFDPFFSGREAGRGRGLGLSIAWRLARVNGGDVRYAPTPGGPTRFVLTLPALSVAPDTMSA